MSTATDQRRSDDISAIPDTHHRPQEDVFDVGKDDFDGPVFQHRLRFAIILLHHELECLKIPALGLDQLEYSLLSLSLLIWDGLKRS